MVGHQTHHLSLTACEEGEKEQGYDGQGSNECGVDPYTEIAWCLRLSVPSLSVMLSCTSDIGLLPQVDSQGRRTRGARKNQGIVNYT